MRQAQNGDTVRIHYTGRLDDGTVFDSSEGDEPLQFTMGDGRIIAGFENAVMGMRVNEKKTAVMPPDQAYGPHNAEMVVEVDRGQLPDEIDPAIGDQLQMVQEDGEMLVVLVTNVTDGTVTLDANHPLAGKNLTFEITLVEIL